MASDNVNNYEIVAAIDFGTTYSGYAYSYRYEQERIFVNSNWPSGLQTMKEATAILFNECGQFVTFGGDAITRYSDFADCDEEKTYYFFNRFKMSLYGEKCTNNINRQLVLTASNGKQMKAVDVFSSAITFFKDHLINSVNRRNAGNCITVESIRWVLTVPAIWSDSAKQFMRESAEKAGIPKRCLVIALEPECASIYCQSLPEEKLRAKADFKKSGARYLVLDNGGGTVDVTVHQIIDENRVREVYKATGGAWGGTKVDESFVEYLVSMFSDEVIQTLKKQYASDWVDMMRDFEQVKRTISLDNGEDYVRIMLRPCVRDVYQEVMEVNLVAAFQNNISRKGATLRGARLQIPKKVIAEMIENVSKSISSHARFLMQQTSDEGLDFIMMVGGFSNSPIVVDEVKKVVGDCMPVIVPEEAHLAVLRGAVIFGWKPDAIKTRKSRKTYGISMVVNFKENAHPKRLMFLDDDNKPKCKMVFDKLVSVNEEIEIDQKVTRYYYPVYHNQMEMNIILYATESEEVNFCDELSVRKVGVLVVPMVNTANNKRRKVIVDVKFGDTEFNVHARDEDSGKDVNATYDFLNVI